MITVHVFSFEQHFLDDGITPHCDCGWMGRLEATIEDAADAWDNHCDVEFMKATEIEDDPR